MTHATEETPVTTYNPLRPGFVVADAPPTDDQRAVVAATGGHLNPDTNLPMPAPTALQRQLVAELIGSWDEAKLLDGDSARLRGTLEATLTEAIVRQHGRTTRATIRNLFEHAEASTSLSREHAEKAANVADLAIRAAELSLAYSHATNARLLTGLHLDARA